MEEVKAMTKGKPLDAGDIQVSGPYSSSLSADTFLQPQLR